jgi:hypothetical protein
VPKDQVLQVVSLACHNRAEDEEVGAAPDQGDTTAVTHVIDSTRTGPPGVGGRPGDATITPDSVGVDSAGVDSALTNQEAPGTPGTPETTSTWTSTPQDTLGPQDTGVDDTTMHGDSAMMHSDSTMMHGDSAMTNHPVPDTTVAQ